MHTITLYSFQEFITQSSEVVYVYTDTKEAKIYFQSIYNNICYRVVLQSSTSLNGLKLDDLSELGKKYNKIFKTGVINDLSINIQSDSFFRLDDVDIEIYENK